MLVNFVKTNGGSWDAQAIWKSFILYMLTSTQVELKIA